MKEKAKSSIKSSKRKIFERNRAISIDRAKKRREAITAKPKTRTPNDRLRRNPILKDINFSIPIMHRMSDPRRKQKYYNRVVEPIIRTERIKEQCKEAWEAIQKGRSYAKTLDKYKLSGNFYQEWKNENIVALEIDNERGNTVIVEEIA